MPFFSPKTWKQRIVEFPGRRRLDDTSSADVYDVSRAEGTVTQEGDGFTAANMNDLEQRISGAVSAVAGLSVDEYDEDSTYSAGDLRIHDNILYKANQDISVAEAWTPAHWDATTIAAELKAQAEDISELNSSLKRGRIDIASGIQLDYNGYLATLYLGITAQSYSEGWNIIGTIPESYRPSRELDFVVTDNLANSATDATPILSRIDSDGNIKVYAYPDKNRFAPDGSVTYILD